MRRLVFRRRFKDSGNTHTEMKLKDLAKLIGIERIVATNIDDVVYKARELGIKELEVLIEEMNILTQFYLANSGDKDPAKPKILREGKIDRYLGVDIKEQ